MATSGPDRINGTIANDTIFGLEGNDTLLVSAGFDILYGGDGDDTLNAAALGGNGYDAGVDTLYGETGHDLLYVTLADCADGGAGWDTAVIDYTGLSSDMTFVLGAATTVRQNGFYYSFINNVEQVHLTTGQGDDLIVTGAGHDKITLNGGFDTVRSGDGHDQIIAKSLLATIDAGAGWNTIDVRSRVRGDLEIDLALGYSIAFGMRRDLLGFSVGTFHVETSGGRIILRGADYGDTLTVTTDEATLIEGRGGNDTLYGQDKASIYGGQGDDKISLAADSTMVGWADGGEGNDQMSAWTRFGPMGNRVTLIGGAGNDVIDAFDLTAIVDAGSGDDRVEIVDGDFWASLGDGNDVLEYDTTLEHVNAHSGTVLAGAGDDVVAIYGAEISGNAYGDAGADLFILQLDWDRMPFDRLTTVATAAGMELRINGVKAGLINGFERVVLDGGRGHDSLRGTMGADQLTGDTSRSGALIGGGNDTLSGLGGNDTLYGFSGNDILDGGMGDDLLSGNLGRDRMTGGQGRDTFEFLHAIEIGIGTNRDLITDFVVGVDKLDFSEFDGTFRLMGNAGFDGAAMALRWSIEGRKTFVRGDVDGNGQADFELELTGAKQLQAGDFLL